jgi:hypothetical protein
MAKLSFKDEKISQPTLSTPQEFFENIAPKCMYRLGYTFSLQGFVREVFWYYRLGPGQLHPNKWIILSVFDKFLRIVRIMPTVNIF